MARGEGCVLYDRPKVRLFVAGQEPQLRAQLSRMEVDTSTEPITCAEDLILDKEGRTPRGYRYTRVGFTQVTQCLAKGLSNLLTDVAGMVHRKDSRDRMVDAELALHVFGRMVQLRYPAVSSYRLLLNHQDKLIEGLVGAKQQFLNNAELYQMAEQSISQHRADVVLHTAVIIGRRMALWYRARGPMFTLPVEKEIWPFYHGYYFCNGEATGTSVRGTLALFCKHGLCLGPYKTYGDRVTHAGKDFSVRLGSLFTKVLTHDFGIALFQDGALRLRDESLGFADKEERERRAQERRLTHGLTQLGVQKNLAKHVVESALYVGRAEGPPPGPVQRIDLLFNTRKMLDLLVSLMRAARRLDLERREKVEQAAFALLTGRFMV